MFKRKVYDELLEWKKTWDGKYACLLEGARRVGKTTIAREFARNEYESYILIDFSNTSKEMLALFDDISKLDRFFLRLQVEAGVELFERKSVIIFDEIQLFPKARQAIKHLVKDGRYDYIETGSLISIKKNVKDILIPSEEHKIHVYPMDYEEFLWATGGNPNVLNMAYKSNVELGNAANRNAMRDFRIYMAVGGMPQAVESYIATNSFEAVDRVKREILELYYDDLKKIDDSGRITDMYKSVPCQLASKRKHYAITAATGKQKTRRDEERLFELIESGLVLPCYNVLKPDISLLQTKDMNCFKLYLSDIGLFTTMLFNDTQNGIEDIYKKLLSDTLTADLGYLYENVVAQAIKSSGRELYYHIWKKERSTHLFEIDFLIASKNKVIPIEVKSSAVKNHKSIDNFAVKYSKCVGERFLLSQKDVGKIGTLKLKPIYMILFLLKDL
ncbi:MAG: ATP-binding protein [Lachnospiraceae bacterium]|nr:ATP-binding protein [Lachnospiraceae bacterium]